MFHRIFTTEDLVIFTGELFGAAFIVSIYGVLIYAVVGSIS